VSWAARPAHRAPIRLSLRPPAGQIAAGPLLHVTSIKSSSQREFSRAYPRSHDRSQFRGQPWLCELDLRAFTATPPRNFLTVITASWS